MTAAIVASWWIFLIAALLLTLIDVYLLLHVISLCRQIRTLTGATLTAAVGASRNTDAGRELGRMLQVIPSLTKKPGEIERLTGMIGKQLVRGT